MEKPTDGIIVRLLKEKDNQAIQTIIQNSLREKKLDKPGTAYYDPYLGNLYGYYKSRPNSAYWVAVDSTIDRVVGGVGISYFGKQQEIAELQKYYVLKDYQKRGIGSLLFKRALNFACEKRYQAVYIETMDILKRANLVYEHFGFKQLNQPLSGSEHGLMNRWYLKKCRLRSGAGEEKI